MLKALFRGAAAGAAGTTALNAVTYLDMAARGRPTSDAPQQVVEKLSGQAGVQIPGQGEERENRLAGLGPLAGVLTGVGVGAVAGLFGPVFGRLPLVVSGVLLGGAVMAGSNVPMAKLGISDPSSWSSTDWASDIAPHLMYGLVTAGTLKALRA